MLNSSYGPLHEYSPCAIWVPYMCIFLFGWHSLPCAVSYLEYISLLHIYLLRVYYIFRAYNLLHVCDSHFSLPLLVCMYKYNASMAGRLGE